MALMIARGWRLIGGDPLADVPAIRRVAPVIEAGEVVYPARPEA